MDQTLLRSETVQLCFIIILTMLCLVPLGFILVAGCFVLQATRKVIRFFICHHKLAAGALARLLKMRLCKLIGVNRKVFVDSDDLKDLNKLHGYMACIQGASPSRRAGEI